MGQLVLDLFSAVEPTPDRAPASAPRAPAIQNNKPFEESPARGEGPSMQEPWGQRDEVFSNDLEHLTIVFSSRLKRTWRLERPRGANPVLHLPKPFRTAPSEIWIALGAWVRAHRKPHPGTRAQARTAAAQVFAWMGERQDRAPGGGPQGNVHDLAPLFERLNREHFQGRLEALVRWSPKPGGLSTHRTLQLADGPRHVITIGQIYDHPDVPTFAVEGVLFHEMLHIEFPPQGEGLRRHVHHARFRQAERAFPGYLAWKEWERREAPRLLRALRRATARQRRARRG